MRRPRAPNEHRWVEVYTVESTKRSKKSGQFMDQKKDGKKFKGVRREQAH